MRFSLRRLDVVESDLTTAGIWYEDQNPGAGLSRALVEEADEVILSLAAYALHHRIRFRDVRRAPFERFAFFGVYYVVRAETAVVIAIFHDRRHPGRVQQRRREVEDEL